MIQTFILNLLQNPKIVKQLHIYYKFLCKLAYLKSFRSFEFYS